MGRPLSTHICLEARDEIYDGYGLRLAIHDWLRENVGTQASDMTDFVWGKKVGFYMRVTDNRINPMYQTSGDRQTGGKFLHFLFRDANKAMLFKLAWGGR